MIKIKQFSKLRINSLLKEYEKNGYMKLGKIISKKNSEILSKRTVDLMLGKIKYDGMFFQLDASDGNYNNIEFKNESFSGPSLNYRKIKDLEYDPYFFSIIKSDIIKKISNELIGPDVSSMRCMILNKPSKNSSELKFHQDVGLKWSMSDRPAFTLWLSINGANKNKGGLKIIEKSHKEGVIKQGHFVEKKLNYLKKKYKIKYLDLKPGEAIIFNNLLVHGSEKNKTDNMRIAFTACLMSSKIRHLKYNKKYPKIFGNNSLTLKSVMKLKKIPKKVYVK